LYQISLASRQTGSSEERLSGCWWRAKKVRFARQKLNPRNFQGGRVEGKKTGGNTAGRCDTNLFLSPLLILESSTSAKLL